MKHLLTSLLLLLICKAQAQSNYSTDLIPKELISHAGAIVRNEEIIVEIKEKDDVVYHYKQAITVLNKNGDDEAELVIQHNKTNSIKYIKGCVYDEFGKQTKKITEKDFEDDGYGGYSLFEDSRFKHYNPAITTYPYTVEYDYEVHSKQSLNIYSWFPIDHQEVSVEKSSYQIICKPDCKISYKESNYPGTVDIANLTGNKVYSWKILNLKAYRSEPYSPQPTAYMPNVRVSVNDFMYEGLTGSYNNWNDLGKWMYDKLLAGRAELPQETVAMVKSLTKDITDPKLKAKKIYEYMQQKCRYVSIQMGIGGYRPFKASEVEQLSYGDCKALVNYTQALLKAAEIESYYCVVKSGSRKASLINDFASMSQADHVILCLPFKNDTTWLECTSKTIPFGFLGTFTDDRWVLACTPAGGKLLHTPKYMPDDNLETINATFNISESGELNGNMATTSTGTQYDDREAMLEESYADQIKGVKKYYPINNLNIETFKLEANKSIKPAITENIKFKAPEFASVENNKVYFTVNAVNRLNNVPREIRNRTTGVYINRGYTDEDVITYTIPTGFRFDKNLMDIDVHKKFGSYTARISVNGNHLVYKRKMQIIDGNYSKEDYEDLVNFYETIAEADNFTMCLVKEK